jgi:hypothetical protein
VNFVNTSTVTVSVSNANGISNIALTTTAAAVNVARNSFEGDGSNTDFTLTLQPANEDHALVFVDRVLQRNNEYNVTTTTLSFTSAPDANSVIDVFIFGGSEAVAAGGGFQGTVSGYTSGGWPTGTDTIDKFPFASDSNATDVGNLTQARGVPAGQSSSSHGYTSGGRSNVPDNAAHTTIDKFPFASDANATDVGDLTVGRRRQGGQSSSDNGYTSGGYSNVIDKFPFASDGNATDVGDLTQSRAVAAGQSSDVNGYNSGGYVGGFFNTIDKFPFATDENATDVGDLTTSRSNSGGQSSSDNGYTSGGITSGATTLNIIDKFPFASDANATDVGDLTSAQSSLAGQSSTVSGYNTKNNDINKFPFASDGNATDVGDLTETRSGPAGQQV